MDVDRIISANPFINVYNLQVGDVICLPCVSRDGFLNSVTYTVENGDTLGSVIAKNRINIADFLKANDIYSISLMPGTILSIPVIEE